MLVVVISLDTLATVVRAHANHAGKNAWTPKAYTPFPVRYVIHLPCVSYREGCVYILLYDEKVNIPADFSAEVC